jgi:hypothetical protein
MGGLAPWWLNDDVLEAARQYHPARFSTPLEDLRRLPEKLGDCWLVFRAGRGFPELRRAFLLPLTWRPGRGHAQCLPPKLLRLADRVIGELDKHERTGTDWSLHPADELRIYDERAPGAEYLATADLRCSSCWASLAGGLIARAEGLLPRASVWASGAWNEDGLADVDVRGLEAKLALAAEWPSKPAMEGADPIWFYVPRWRAGAAAAWARDHVPGQVTIGILDAPTEPVPRKALNAYLAELTACPPVPDPDSPDEPAQFAHCRNWLLHQTAFTDRERSFYRSHLLPGIIRRMRTRVRGIAPPDFAATHYATVVSKSHELAVMTPLALGVTHCLLLHTPDAPMPELARRCAHELVSRGLTCTVRAFDNGPDMVAQIEAEIEGFTRGLRPDCVVIDLKPGTKKMTYAQSRAARRGNWLFNLEAAFLDERRTDPGTERPELWRARE